ncbi:MAG: transposase [Actinomycetia bacterium]|nr:transposase [Actinomycetes bacterium]
MSRAFPLGSGISAWHRAHVSNGRTEAANNLIKVVERIAFGFRNYRIRSLLYAGKPNWNLLPTITPTSP